MNIESKLPLVGTSIFSLMSSLALQHNAINLGQGFPDYNMDDALIQLTQKYMLLGYNQYAPMAGVELLRQAIAYKIKESYNAIINYETEVTITPGASYGIYNALASIIYPGDEVIILEPAYDCYIPAIQMHGGTVKPVSLIAPTFNVDWNTVATAVNNKTKAIIINTPHNPCGYCFTQSDWDALYEIIKDKNIFVLSDEVYEHITFNAPHLSILMQPQFKERAIAVFSFGKVFHNTGWKIGYVVANEKISTEIRKIHQYIAFSTNTPAQYALAEYLNTKENYLLLPEFFKQKRDYFLNGLTDSKFSLHHPAAGSFFQILGYENISNKNDIDFAKELTINYKVTAVPLSPFYTTSYNGKFLRFCFAKKQETLAQSITNLLKL